MRAVYDSAGVNVTVILQDTPACDDFYPQPAQKILQMFINSVEIYIPINATIRQILNILMAEDVFVDVSKRQDYKKITLFGSKFTILVSHGDIYRV